MVMRGHYQYYGVPRNYEALRTFRYQTALLWKRALEGAQPTQENFAELDEPAASNYLPNHRIYF
jgi:hypothetical protein